VNARAHCSPACRQYDWRRDKKPDGHGPAQYGSAVTPRSTPSLAGLVAAAALLLSACGTGTPTAQVVEAPGSPERADLAQAPAPGGSCPQPYEPWWTVDRLHSQEVPLPPREASLNVEPDPLDMDGDGIPDEIVRGTPEAPELRVRRGDGELVLVPSAGDFLSANPLAIGDLDGDGRHELLVRTFTTGDDPDWRETMYIVPGTTAPGTHAIADVGIVVDVIPVELAIGDQDGDGADDLVVPYGAGWRDLALVSGREVMAVGPGGDGRSLEPFRALPGFVGLAQLTDGAPTAVTGRQVGPYEVELEVLLDPPVALRSLPDTSAGPSSDNLLGFLDSYVSGGDRIVSWSHGTRSGTWIRAWNLDDPCARWATAGTPTPLPPSPPPSSDAPVSGALLPATG
jgi:hypothetical protein